MTKLKQLSLILSVTTMSMSSMASDFSFDRPGTGFGTANTKTSYGCFEKV